MNIDLIAVPYHLGKLHIGSGLAAAEITELAADRLEQAGHMVGRQRVAIETETMSEREAIQSVNHALAGLVRRTSWSDVLPLVIAGNCNHSIGVLSGLDDPTIGVIWFDAHADLNTPETSTTGYYDGMALAQSCRDAFTDLRYQLGMTGRVSPGNILFCGVRDIDPGEQTYIDQESIAMLPVPASMVEAQGMLDSLKQRNVSSVYIHVDIDCLDSQGIPGADFPTPGGLSSATVESTLRSVRDQFHISAFTLATTYDPSRDAELITQQTVLCLLDWVG